MALNIPMPGLPGDSFLKGLDTGSTLFSRYMHPIIQREQLAEQGKYHQGTLSHQQKQLEQQSLHHGQQLELQKQQLAQSHAFDAIKKQVMQQQLLKLQHSNDPMYEFQQFQNLENMFGGQQQKQPQEQGNPLIPFGEGQGMFNPESIPPQQENKPTNTNIEALRQNPMLRGFFKHKFGFDPLSPSPQTPEEKKESELDLFKRKEAIKAENKKSTAGDVPLTTSIKTKLQGVVTGVDNSLPVVEELINDFKNLPTGSETFNPAAYAAYNSKANSIIEPLINAFGLNITDATKEMMHDQVFRKTNEPLFKYRNRLVDLAKEIIRRRNDSYSSLQTGRINPKTKFTSEYFENLKNEKKIIDGKEYQKINGEWHEI